MDEVEAATGALDAGSGIDGLSPEALAIIEEGLLSAVVDPLIWDLIWESIGEVNDGG